MNEPSDFRLFRLARPAGPAWNVVKTAVQVVVFWGVFLVLIPQALTVHERRLGISAFAISARPVVLTVLIVASALGLCSAWTMATYGAGTPLPLDAPRHLVVRGPYRYIRNPMAVAGLTQGACVAALLGSPLSLLFVAAGFVVWNYAVRPLEESHLAAQFGEEYRAYQRAVRCWVPRLRGYRSGV